MQLRLLNKIKQIIGKGPTYISLDMDVLDMFSAPSVSTPSPCGLTGREILYILSELSKENIIGIDLVEITPKNDEDLYTAAMGAKLLIEFLVRHNNYH